MFKRWAGEAELSEEEGKKETEGWGGSLGHVSYQHTKNLWGSITQHPPPTPSLRAMVSVSNLTQDFVGLAPLGSCF